MPHIFFIALTKINRDIDNNTNPADAFNTSSLFLFIILHNPPMLAIVMPNAIIEDHIPLNFTFVSFLSAPTNKFNDIENASKESTLLLAPGVAFARAENSTKPPAILASISKRSPMPSILTVSSFLSAATRINNDAEIAIIDVDTLPMLTILKCPSTAHKAAKAPLTIANAPAAASNFIGLHCANTNKEAASMPIAIATSLIPLALRLNA